MKLFADALVGVDLVSTNFNARDSGKCALVYLERDDQIFTADRDTLQNLNISLSITQVTHEGSHCSLVSFQQSEAGVPASVTKKRNQPKRAGLLAFQFSLDIW